MKRFTAQQLKDWQRYEAVRKSGRWNMYWPQAQKETGLSEARYMFCLKNYSELKAAVASAPKGKR